MVDKRTKRGKELAARLNKEFIWERMPKIYYVLDGDRVRVGRTDYPGDTFDVWPTVEFDIFKKIYEKTSLPLIDATYDED